MNETSDQSSTVEATKIASQCPVCRYSLVDLAVDQPCPECGVEIDRDLITAPELDHAVGVTRWMCVGGFIGWMIVAFVYWAMSIALMGVSNYYFSGSYEFIDYAGVWFRTGFVIAPLALLGGWLFGARGIIYRCALKDPQGELKMRTRVVVLGLPGVLFGILGLGVIAYALNL